MGKGDKNVPVDDTETRTKKKKKRQTGKRREIPELNAIKSTAKEMEVKKKKTTQLLSENSAPEDPPHLGRDINMKQIIAHSWFAEIVSKLSPS